MAARGFNEWWGGSRLPRVTPGSRATRTSTRTNTRAHTRMHGHTQEHTCTRTSTRAHTCTRTRMHTLTHSYTLTHTHSRTHTHPHMHTLTHTHTHSLASGLAPNPPGGHRAPLPSRDRASPRRRSRPPPLSPLPTPSTAAGGAGGHPPVASGTGVHGGSPGEHIAFNIFSLCIGNV